MSDAPDFEALLGEHADCITNCDIKTVGVRDGQMWYVIHWTCGMTSGPLTLGSTPIRDDHRAHVASVLEAHTADLERAAAEKALAEHAECVPKTIADQWLAQVERLQETVQKCQQKENDHARTPEQRPDSVDPEKPTLDPAHEDSAADPTPTDRRVPEDDATEVRPADRIPARALVAHRPRCGSIQCAHCYPNAYHRTDKEADRG